MPIRSSFALHHPPGALDRPLVGRSGDQRVPGSDFGRLPTAITSGPDGALWFTESVGKIGRIAIFGDVTEFELPTPNTLPSSIVTGPDGAL